MILAKSQSAFFLARILPLGRVRLPVRQWWRGLDLNQRRLSQRIYSPSPLTTRALLRTAVGAMQRGTYRTGRARQPDREAPYGGIGPKRVNRNRRHAAKFEAARYFVEIPAPCGYRAAHEPTTRRPIRRRTPTTPSCGAPTATRRAAPRRRPFRAAPAGAARRARA